MFPRGRTIVPQEPSRAGVDPYRKLGVHPCHFAISLAAGVCQYENSPDGHLILDKHPALKNVWLAGGGSGHGFKLAPALGEMVARGATLNRGRALTLRLT